MTRTLPYQLTNQRHQFCFPAFDRFIDFGALAAVFINILSSKGKYLHERSDVVFSASGGFSPFEHPRDWSKNMLCSEQKSEYNKNNYLIETKVFWQPVCGKKIISLFRWVLFLFIHFCLFFALLPLFLNFSCINKQLFLAFCSKIWTPSYAFLFLIFFIFVRVNF